MYGILVKFVDGRERTLRTNSLSLVETWLDRYLGHPAVLTIVGGV